jgi:beta-N-acetylhexosaminidase
MRRLAASVATTIATTVAATLVAATPTFPAVTTHGSATWSDRRIAMQLVLAGIQMDHLSQALTWAKNGVGGIVLFGTPPKDLGAQLAQVRAANPVPPFVSSDEEGGEVQRLSSLIYRLRSAEWMGAHRSVQQVRARAADYAPRMKALGVDMDLAPDTDLLVPGHYISQVHRAFASAPTAVGDYANAWQRGMRSGHVVPVVKHWPGLGHSGNTDDSLQSTPPLRYMKAHDMRSFEATFAAHVPAAMVGNMVVPGLTETDKTPASLSPAALHLLRKQGGDHLLIITDSLSAGAVRDGLGLSQAQAAVRALESGADMALVDGVTPRSIADAIVAALQSGHYARPAAMASVRRIMAAKRLTTPPDAPTAFTPADGATGVARTVTLSVRTHDPLGGKDHVWFALRRHHSTAWSAAPTARVTVPAGTRASYQPGHSLASGAHYEWRVRSCNTARFCSAWSRAHGFTTG